MRHKATAKKLAAEVPPVPVPVDIIQVSFTATANDSTASHYNFNETRFTRGTGLIRNVIDGRVDGLIAGRTYELIANAQLQANTAGNGAFRFVDLTGNATIGEHFELISANNGTATSGMGGQVAFFTPGVNSSVGIDFVAGTHGELDARTTFTVKEV